MQVEEQVSPFVESAVECVNRDLPTSFAPTVDTYYVRECYSVYYDIIMNLLFAPDSKCQIVTLTGTPGIGKSMFYQYFFTRYRRENPAATIVTAAFTKYRQTKACYVFVPNQDPQKIKRGDLEDAEDEHPDAIHLYDGPPNIETIKAKMVTFTSPNAAWLDAIFKYGRAKAILYMPVWELAEMARAATLLELAISQDELYQRYCRFGGEVRYCLETDLQVYNEGETKLQDALNEIETLQDIKNCITLKLSTEKIVHRLLHYDVSLNNPQSAKLKIASKSIGNDLYKRFQDALSEERARLMQWLDGAGKASTLHGWLFENLAHEVLLKGGSFQCALLDNSDVVKMKNLKIDPPLRRYERFPNDFTLDMIFKKVYHIPECQNFKSIDSFYMSNDNIIMFQITKAREHPVNPSGLIDLFIKLNALERIREVPTRACLVFVVPKGKIKDFKRQKINTDHKYNAKWMQDPVTIIPGIGPLRHKKLALSGVYTCQQLWEARSCGDCLSEANFLEKFMAKIEMVRDVSFLHDIPQLLLEIDVDKIIM